MYASGVISHVRYQGQGRMRHAQLIQHSLAVARVSVPSTSAWETVLREVQDAASNA
jgi:hypothetical protein